jgi:hypothetical protein
MLIALVVLWAVSNPVEAGTVIDGAVMVLERIVAAVIRVIESVSGV